MTILRNTGLGFLLCVSCPNVLLELTDLMFFIKSIKYPADHFNINDFVSFSDSITRSTSHHKLLHSKVSTNYSRHFYFHLISRLWKSLPPINLDASLFTIKSNLVKLLWAHFDSHFDSNNPCSFHYLCPCNSCHYSSNFTVVN